MLSGGAERDLVRVETSSLDAVSAALHAETPEAAAGNLRRHSHSRHRLRRPVLVFGRAAVVRRFPCRRHKTRQTDVGDFLLAKKDFVVLRGRWCIRRRLAG
jgi:hypothetical protein